MTLIPRAEHPRPDWQREKWLNLNGDWDFDFSEEEKCPALNGTIVVPFSWASPLSKVEQNRKGTGWYRKVVRFDAKGEIWLVIGAADYETKVFINGQTAGEHKGGYGEIRLNVSSFWKREEENEICIRVTDTDEDCQTRGKQGYGEIRGIWQTVYLEETPETYLENAKIETRCDGTVTIWAQIVSPKEGEECLTASFGGEEASACMRLVPGENEMELMLKIDQPRLWTPEEPNLYEGELRLGEDCVKTYFGLREIGFSCFGGRSFPWITLNGKPIYLNGTLDQSFNPKGYFTLPSEQDVIEEVQRLKALKLNLVRLHIKPEEPRKLYWMDKLGILAFADMVCYWGEPTTETRRQFEKELDEFIRRDWNHPSIMAWIVFNETWGLFDRADADHNRQYSPKTQEWVREMYRHVKAMDPTRIVEDNSACNRDHVETDLNTWHFYLNGYMTVKEEVDIAAKGARKGGSWNFIGENRSDNIPLMNSECGMVWGVQDSAGDSDLAWQYHYMLNEFRLHENLCGFVFTEFHDVINEFNGYYRIDNQKKNFGYDLLGMGMQLEEMHAPDFIAYDAPPCRTIGSGEEAETHVYYSNFGGVSAGKKLTLEWFLHGVHGYYAQGSREFLSEGDGKMDLGSICVKMPELADTAALTFRLVSDGKLLSRNFCTFDVRGPRACVAYVRPRDYVEEHFANKWQALSGHKVCGVGEGSFVYEIPTEGFEELDAVELRFEAGAKMQLKKDANGAVEQEEGADYMAGYRVDPGENHNSYFMTDEKLFPSHLTVLAEGEKVLEQELPDDPADCNGVLSWHYQERERYLDEAGSYGYLILVPIGKKILQKAKEKGKLRLEFRSGRGGLALYGRNSGRFPIDIEILPKY